VNTGLAIGDDAAVRRIGRYEIVREVGRGATSIVYLARQTDLDRNVALKELAQFHAADPAFIDRFLRESRLAGSLNHPNIVTVHEYFEHEGAAYIAMEYLERGSLRPYVGRLTTEQIAGVLEGLLSGLAHAESQGVVHRDLKPENVLVTSNGGVKIADFGIAKALEPEPGAPLTQSEATVGTPAYMAPEQATAGAVGPWTDLYALGVLAYELFCGEVPFHDSPLAMAVLLQHVNDPVPPLRVRRPELDPALARWVERLLAKAPRDRTRSAAVAAEELEEIVIGALGARWRRQSRITESIPAVRVGPASTETTSPLRPSSRRSRRRAWAASLAGAVVVLGAVGAAAAVAWPDNEPRQTTTLETRPRLETQVTKPTPAKKVVRPVLRGVVLVDYPTTTQATLRLRGGALAPDAVVVRDADITDGRGWFELRQRGIDKRTSEAADDGVDILVRKGPGKLRVDVGAEPGAYEQMIVLRMDGRTVLVTLTKPVEPPPVTITPPATDTRPTTTEPDETPPDGPPRSPPLNTG
jgi:tRNA A-37 threonylcarbamoyl transferase component Bud32